jgi:hypothetical protein
MMPTFDIWVQFTIVAILFVVAASMATAFYKLWKDWVKWIELQDTKRDNERERQRTWQEKQDILRDERWHSFLRQLQDEWTQETGRHSARIEMLIIKVEELTKSVTLHDIWARSKDNR